MRHDITLAFWSIAPGVGELRPQPLPAPGQGELRIRTLYSGISRGTESLVLQGRVPPSEFERMRAPFQEGYFPFPVKYGYASVGVVEAGPDGWPGRSVFCLYPHQQRYNLPAEAAVPLPDGVPAARAVLASNLETAINACWDARPAVGERICVIGAGVVGSLVAWLCARIPGTRVVLVDPQPTRAALAATLGCRFATPEALPENTPEAGFDLLFHASGNPAGLTQALTVAGQEARIIELSWYGDRDVELPLGAGFHARRLRLISSQVGQIPAWCAPRRRHRDRLTLALELLADPVLDCLISGESDFDSLPETLNRLSIQPAGALCHRIRYPER
ncbi:MAG: zinc-dependent alcohol dehydrogenase [Rhodocyclaceae bacterium]